MEPLALQRERVQDDLRGLVGGDVRCDDIHRQLYAGDGSIYQIFPAAVVQPRSVADVVACVQYAAEEGIPVHARGAGSGATGGALGPGLVLDFSKYLRRVIRVDEDSVRVQAGTALERLNELLARQRRVLGPDPLRSDVTTVGSMIAVDALGSRWLKYGSMARHVRSLQVVTAEGHLLEIGREPVFKPNSGESSPKQELVDRLTGLLAREADVITDAQRDCPIDGCGYRLAGAIDGDQLDLAGLVVGSEGTLALVTEATLTTEPLPRQRGMVMLLFDSLERASQAIQEILPKRPTACDLVDRRHLSLACETEVRYDLLIPQETEALLLVEYEGDQAVVLRDAVRDLVDEVWHRRQLAFGARVAFDPEEAALFRQLVTKVHPAAYPIKGPLRPIPVVEDLVVAPKQLSEFLGRIHNVLRQHRVTSSLIVHAGQGQIRLQPFLDPTDAEGARTMRHLADDLYEEVLAAGGSICGEHVCGLSRTAYVTRQAGRLYDVFCRVKQVFDPNNILNPGKIIASPQPRQEMPLRPAIPAQRPAAAADDPTASSPAVTPPLRNLVELQLRWDPERVLQAVNDCNRCGYCRVQSPAARMCPIFRYAPDEAASPRAKVNLLFGVLTGGIELERLTSDEFKAVADLCIHCHMCRLECPAKVDIPRLMREGKGAYVESNGLRLFDWVMTRLDLFAAAAAPFSSVANWALGNRQARWALEKLLGIAQGRKLPRVASRSFLRQAARRRLTRPVRHNERKVVYLVDTYANCFDTQLAAALIAVLEHNGVSVYVPPQQKPAGMASFACGALSHARSLAERNLSLLAEAVRQGYHVVSTEPSAALCLVREYPQLIDDEDARLVGTHTSEACSYLWRMHTKGLLQLDLKPINASLGYHMPCHLKALEVGSPGENLLRLIPGIKVQRIEEGCSGMGGTFGLKGENYRRSLRAGWRLITRLRDEGIQAGVTECSTCKIQMEQGTTKPTVHPIKLLALSYGLMPEVAALLTTPGEELTVT